MKRSSLRLKKIVSYGTSVALGISAIAWVVGFTLYPAENPPQQYEGLIISEKSDQILRRACFDCHSNETKFPWYYHLPVTNILMGNSIQNGRKDLNFSYWDQISPEKQLKQIKHSLDHIEEGVMPPRDYKMLHRQHLPTTEEVEAMRKELEMLIKMQSPKGMMKMGGKSMDDHYADGHTH